MNMSFSDLDQQRTFGGKLILALVWLLVPVILGARWAVDGSLADVGGGSLAIAVGAILAWRFAGRDSLGRSLSAVALMGQVSMLVAAMSANSWQIDMHMAYFAALALLVIYCDWIAIAAAATTVAVHHLGLSYLLPAAVFPDAASLGRVLVHAVILIIEASILIGVALSVNAMFLLNDEARRKAEGAVDEARAAEEVAAAARRSEEAGRAQFAEGAAIAERDRAQTVSMLAQGLSRLAAGDLTVRIEADFEAHYAQLKIDFNAAVESLRATMSAITLATTGFVGGSDEIAGASGDLSRRMEGQVARLAQTAAALDGITTAVQRSADGAAEASAVVSTAKTDAERAGGVVKDAVGAMSEIEQSSGEITQIIGVIDEIAFQTNLLALNAGVEAARAGATGKGFAVVAQEVRALAQRSADAAKQIKALIATSTQHVARGVNLVGETGAALSGIVAKVADIDALISGVVRSARAQAGELVQVNVAVNEMDELTRQNASVLETAAASAGGLRAEAEDIATRLTRFQTESARPTRAPSGRRAA